MRARWLFPELTSERIAHPQTSHRDFPYKRVPKELPQKNLEVPASCSLQISGVTFDVQKKNAATEYFILTVDAA